MWVSILLINKPYFISSESPGYLVHNLMNFHNTTIFYHFSQKFWQEEGVRADKSVADCMATIQLQTPLLLSSRFMSLDCGEGQSTWCKPTRDGRTWRLQEKPLVSWGFKTGTVRQHCKLHPKLQTTLSLKIDKWHKIKAALFDFRDFMEIKNDNSNLVMASQKGNVCLYQTNWAGPGVLHTGGRFQMTRHWWVTHHAPFFIYSIYVLK